MTVTQLDQIGIDKWLIGLSRNILYLFTLVLVRDFERLPKGNTRFIVRSRDSTTGSGHTRPGRVDTGVEYGGRGNE